MADQGPRRAGSLSECRGRAARQDPGRSVGCDVLSEWPGSESSSPALPEAPVSRIEIEQELDGRWVAEVPIVPGALAYGSTREEASAPAEALPCAPWPSGSSMASRCRRSVAGSSKRPEARAIPSAPPSPGRGGATSSWRYACPQPVGPSRVSWSMRVGVTWYGEPRMVPRRLVRLPSNGLSS